MIDFRFHMVSLAAVLIALSMGIVLGAGPLNDDIGNTLTNEVTRLRQDKDDLRRQLTEEQRAASARDDFEEQVLPGVLAGTLDGQRVGIVRLPESDDTVVRELEGSLEDAGATVDLTVAVNAAWIAPGDEAAASRDEVASEALSDLGRPGTSAPSLDSVLGVIVGGRTSDGSQAPDAAQRRAAFERLSDAGLVKGDEPGDPVDLVVVIGGPVAGDPQRSASSPDPVAVDAATAWVQLARALDVRSGGTVLLSGPPTYASGDASPVTVARGDNGLSEGVSTVDTPGTPLGRAATVLALEEQRRGEAGSYGTASDASSAVPDRQ